jgi:signal transduction histidine kinase
VPGLAALNDLTTEQIEQAIGDARGLHALRLQLILAHRHSDRPAQAQRWLTTAAPALALRQNVDRLPARTPPEVAIADALLCWIDQNSSGAHGDGEACDSLVRHLSTVSHPVARGMLQMSLANLEMTGGDLAAALTQNRLAVDAANQSASGRLRARSLTQRGWLLQQYGLPQAAIAAYARARQFVREDDIEYTTALSVLMGVSQLEAGYSEAALGNMLEGLREADRVGASQRAVRLRDLIAQAHLNQQEPAIARRYLEGVFAGPLPELPTSTRVNAMVTLASANHALGDRDRARTLFDQALHMARETDDQARIEYAERRYAAALLDEGRHEQALVLLNDLIDRLAQREPTTHLVDTLEKAAIAHASIGDHASAYQAIVRSRDTAHAIDSEHFERLLSYQRTELELDRRSAELSALRARESSLRSADKLKTAVLTALLLLGVIGGLLAYLWTNRRLQRQAASAQQAAASELESLVIARTQELEEELANRLLLQEERRQLEANLAEGDKLRSIGQLTSGVAHDFNNLMTVVSLSAEMLRQASDVLTARQQQCVEDILLAAQSGAEVTSGLLAYARQQPQEPEHLALDEYLAGAEALFRRTLGEGIRFELVCGEAGATATPSEGRSTYGVTVDKANLTTAIINLLMNAREALNGRGSVRMRLTAEPEQVSLSVSDDGPGMSVTERERATEPFYTTKEAGKGSGLGLSMVFGFARQSGGDLQLHEADGNGLRATIVLPRIPGLATMAAPAATGPLPPLREGMTVLLVEDQASLRSTLRRLLETMNFQVVDQESADDAAAWVREHGVPDLLLSDIVMPGQRTGIELADQLRAQFPTLRVMLMSGYTELVDIDYPLLRKPFGYEELEREIRTVLAGTIEASADLEPS